MERCEVWPGGLGPCGRPVAERLYFVNELMDHPGRPGLGVCDRCLAEYVEEQMLDLTAVQS